MQPRTLSREEEAELARSNKKVKDINHAEFNDGFRASSPSLDNQATGTNAKPSFKDKLVGEIPGAFAQAFDLSDQMEEDSESDDENGEDFKSVREGQVRMKLSRETKKRIRGPWSKAIIVKLVGKAVGLNYMQSRLGQLWAPEGRMDCIDLSYGFFLVRFFTKDDLERVIKRGPWFIGDHFLSLRPWEPFFKPSSANVSLIAVWIRLNELPIELYETEVLREIGEHVGKVLRIDSHTAMEARGRYARICIQIDINKPLVNSILIGRFEQVVTYEGIQKLCFSCGRIGHKVEACPYTICKDKGKEPVVPTEKAQASQTSDGVDGSADRQNEQGTTTHNACEVTEEEGYYGPWMMVSRKRYAPKENRTEYGTGNAGSSAWNGTNQLPPMFAERKSMAVSGPASNISEPRRSFKPKSGAGFKKEVRPWAAKNPGDVTIKARPTSSPNLARSSVDSFKEAVTNLSFNNNPSPSIRVDLPQPSSVKNKKHLARKLATGSSLKCAAPLGENGSDKGSSSQPLTLSPGTRSDPSQLNQVAFEFSAAATAESDQPTASENDGRLCAQVVGEICHADEHLVPDEGVQWPTQCVDCEDRSLAGEQMVSDDGSLAVDHMVSDEGGGAAPFL